MGKDSEYYKELNIYKKRKIMMYRKRLPKYLSSYIHDCEIRYQPNTVIAYANDIYIFFSYIKETNPMLKDTPVKEINMNFLENLTFEDINDYQSYLSYNYGEHEHNVDQPGVSRKMASLRSFFKYMTDHNYMKNDPTLKAAKPKKQDHSIIRMEQDEVQQLLEAVELTDLPSKRARSASSKTTLRDLAIVTLLLHTGMRVSECVGIDIGDINFNENTINIVRKGGASTDIYFDEEAKNALEDYILHERNSLISSNEEKALFVSLNHTRLSARSIERMVRKYAIEAVPNKKITPHKLRSTYGTALYRQSGDIYLVAAVLGHKDVNTTVKHYAAIDEDQKKHATSFNLYDNKPETNA